MRTLQSTVLEPISGDQSMPIVALRPIMLAVVLLWPATQLVADIRLPKIFSDNMVLQRGNQVELWGWADPGETLEITIGNVAVSVTASQQGKWRAQFAPPPAGGPYELKVAGANAQVVFRDVLVGEVWICAGQSNMEWSLSRLAPGDPTEKMQYVNTIPGINDPQLRLFTVGASDLDEPADDFASVNGWVPCYPETAMDFSAVAYYFAYHLQEYWEQQHGDSTASGQNGKFRMPIGLINTSVGGTACEAWTSRAGLQAEPELVPLLEHWRDSGERNRHRPSCLYNGMIAPLAGLAVRGVIWYQGERNVGRGDQYRTLFPNMIRDWRTQLGHPDLPFYFVQLAPHRYESWGPHELPELWEAQLRAMQLPNTGMAVTTDIGDPQDIHPKNKEEVGRRLALWALANTYGAVELACAGPIYDSAEVEGNRIRVRFKHTADGLVCNGAKLSHFVICGPDRQFVPAHAEIDGNCVLVWSEQVPQPVAVRFAWEDTAEPNLFNQAGLPASPFRTDDFPLISKGRHF